MPNIIEVPGFGQVEFPDGMTDEQITAAIQKNMVPKNEPTFMGDVGRSVMRGKQQLDIATTVLGRELGIVSDEEAAKSISRDVAETAKYQPSSRLKQIQKEAEQDKSFGDVLKRYADRPIYDSLRYVTNVITESLVPSIVAGGAGAAAGAVAGSAVPVVGTAAGGAAGLGVGSAAIEYASTILDKLQEAGVDINNPKAVQEFLSDPEKMSEARKSGMLRGIPIGVVDALTAGAAGRFIAPLKAAEQAGKVVGKGQKVVAGLKEAGLQAAGGAGGEALAGLAEKGEINPKAVVDEAIAEIPTGIIETILGVRSRTRKTATPNDPSTITQSDVEDAIRSIKADHDKEVDAFDKMVKSANIPADMQNAVLDIEKKIYSPDTKEEEILKSIEDIKKTWPDYDGSLNALLPSISRLRTRNDAISKMESAVEKNKTRKETTASEYDLMLADLRDVFAQQDFEAQQEAGLAERIGTAATPEEVRAAGRERKAFTKAQAEEEAATRTRMTPDSVVPLVPEEQIAESQAISTEAQQNADTAQAGPFSIREVKKSDGSSAYQIIGDNNKTVKSAIQTRSEAERRAAELNAEAAAKVSESGPAIQTMEAAAESQRPKPLTPTEEIVKSAKETTVKPKIENAKQINQVADTYFKRLKDYRQANASILMKDMENAGVPITLNRAKDIIKSYKPVQKSELSIDNIFSSPDTNPSYNVSTKDATDTINKYLNDMASKGKQGQLSSAALREAIFSRSFDANQAITALKVVNGIEKVMGRAAEKNPVALRFVQKSDSPASRQVIDDKSVNSVLEFSLAPDAIDAAGQNSAHEAMHVLQDLFKYVDPEAHAALSRDFRKGMTVKDMPRNIVEFLKRRENPYSGKSYWDTMQPALEKGGTNENELMAYAFGAINEIMELNPKIVPPVGGKLNRFARFVGNALRSVKESVFGPRGATSLDIMKELATGYRQKQFKEAPLKRMGETGLALTQPSELKISNDINKDLIRMNSHLSSITAEEGIKLSKTYGDYIKEFFDPYHMLGKGANKFRIARAMMSGDIAKITDKIKDIVDDIASAKEDKFTISRYMTTKDANPSMIKDEKARKAAVEAKRLINKIGDELVNRKLITSGEREEFRDQYLPRVYLAYANKKKFVTGGHKPGFMYYLKSREDLSPEQRASLGEIEDPALLIQEALYAPMRDLSILNYFEKLNKLGNGTWVLGMDKMSYKNKRGIEVKLSLPELKTFAHNLEKQLSNGEIAPDRTAQAIDDIKDMKRFISEKEKELSANVDEGRYIQMPKDEERYGGLAGLWVARPIYRDIMGVGSFLPNNMSGLAALFADGTLMSKSTSWFKLAKVALNPPTIATNIISNTLMMHMADVSMHRILPNIAAAFKEVVMDKKGKYYDIAHKYGLKETTLSEVELRGLYRQLELRKSGGSDLNKIMNMFRAFGDAMGKGRDRASAFYGGIETVFKTAIIKDAMENQGLSEADAVLKANKYLFDYSEVHDSIKVLRNIPFGAPFITWSYKMTPLLIETALTKPWKFLPYAAMFYGISQIASAAISEMGGSDEDKERLKKYIAKKTAESPFVLVTGPEDVVDFGKFMPFNNIYKFGKGMVNLDPVEALKAFGFFGGPVADIGTFLITGKDPFTGRDVVPKGATQAEKAIIIANHLANVFMPPFMKDMPQLAIGGITGNMELVGQSSSIVADGLKKAFDGPSGKAAGLPTKSVADLTKNFFGINTYHPSLEQFRRNVLSMQREINDITATMNAAIKDPDLSSDERKKIVEKYTEMKKEKMKEIAEFVKDSNLSPSIYKIVQESMIR